MIVSISYIWKQWKKKRWCEIKKLTIEGYNPKMRRERTGYKTLSKSRMLTGSGSHFSPLCSPLTLSSYCDVHLSAFSTVVDAQWERSDSGATSIRPTAPQPPLPSSDWRQRRGKKFGEGEISWHWLQGSTLRLWHHLSISPSNNLSIYLPIQFICML